MRRLLNYSFSGSFLIFILFAQTLFAQNIMATSDGIIVHPNAAISGNVRAVKLQVINDNIIRVTASPTNTFPQNKSLIIINQPLQTKFTTQDFNDSVQLKTHSITATINKETGAISFTDHNGRPVLSEK